MLIYRWVSWVWSAGLPVLVKAPWFRKYLPNNCLLYTSAANEEAVALFLAGKITFLDIETYVFKAVESIEFIENATLEDIIRSDGAARAFVNEAVKGAV